MNLNPCPFCGGEDLELVTGSGNGNWVMCRDCCVYGPGTESGPEATEAWNKMTSRSPDRLTLREHATLAALNGFLANPDRKAQDPEMAARWSVQHADAVVRALRQNGGK